MSLYRTLLISLLLFSQAGLAAETPWQGELKDGSRISIDPRTNKVTVESKGVTSLLWDGVHQLDNGAVIIVRDGIVVKDNAILKLQREQERKELDEACMVLVRKVCGPRDECADQPACDPARQLLSMDQNDRHNSWTDTVTDSSRKCLEAQHDESFFKACTKRGADTPLSACEKLKKRVCGEADQCTGSEACDAAGQLLKMEMEDRYAGPKGSTQTTEQCTGLLDDKGFFHPCKP